MDRIDWKIISELEREGRLSYAELGDRVGLSKSPCWGRVRALESNGVIQGYGARLDPAALGLAIHCLIEVSIRFDSHAAFEAAVMNNAAIMECHTIAGDSDYILRAYARSADDLDSLLRNDLSKLPGVQRFSTHICLKTVKSRASLSNWADQSQGR